MLTAASRFKSIFVTESSKFLLALAPVRIDLNEKPEEHFLLEEVFHFYARLGSHLLEGLTGLSDDDALLGVAHHIDHRADVVTFCTFRDLLDLHFAAVRNLVLIVEENLFSYDF